VGLLDEARIRDDDDNDDDFVEGGGEAASGARSDSRNLSNRENLT
jgi:hypothetical protein